MKKLIFLSFMIVFLSCGQKKIHGAGDYKTRKFKGNPQKSAREKTRYNF